MSYWFERFAPDDSDVRRMIDEATKPLCEKVRELEKRIEEMERKQKGGA